MTCKEEHTWNVVSIVFVSALLQLVFMANSLGELGDLVVAEFVVVLKVDGAVAEGEVSGNVLREQLFKVGVVIDVQNVPEVENDKDIEAVSNACSKKSTAELGCGCSFE